MLNRHLASSLLIVSFVGGVPSALAQSAPRVRIANPEAVECRFDPVPSGSGSAVRYQVELFRAQDVPPLASPVKSFELAGLEQTGAGTVRLSMRDALGDLSDGDYVATVRSITAEGPSARSLPTAPFAVFARGGRGDVPFIESTPEQRRSERFWTRVAIAIGAGLLVVPFVVQ